jgi:hypothetical protein
MQFRMTGIVTATPMSMREYAAYANMTLPPEIQDDEDGFLLQYETSHESWIDAELFSVLYSPVRKPRRFTFRWR